jgi:hypothetical protein
MKRMDESRMFDDGRIVLSTNHWALLRVWIYDTYIDLFGGVFCHICGKIIFHIMDMELDHWKSPRGLGGGYRDDRFVKPACHDCNSAKGSKRDVPSGNL